MQYFYILSQFHKNRVINEDFYFWGGKILSGGPKGGRVARFKKNQKTLIQNGVINLQTKFQHSSWIRKCLKIGDFWGAFRPLLRGWGVQFQKFEKILIQNDGLNPQPKFQHSSWIRKCLKIGDFWGGFRSPCRGWGVQCQKFEKILIQNGGPNLQQKFQHLRSIRKCLKQI